MSGRLGVVVPAYEPDVELVSTYVRGLVARLDPTVVRIEVDAPSTDVVDTLESLPAELSVSHERRGKGAAITAGFEALAPEVDYLMFVDADGSTTPEYAARVVAPIYEGADLAAGSRRHPDAKVLSHQTFARRRLGDAFAWTARRLLDAKLYDYQCGAKALTVEAWQQLRPHLYEPGFAWDVELLAVAGALDLDIVEVPIEWEDAPGSTVDPLATTLDMARALVVVRYRANRLGEYSPPSFSRVQEEQALVDRK
jgi:hypothetical protein